MGQKTNPHILRLGVTKNWNSRYVEKKNSELPFYDFKTIEIKTFILKFFKNNNLTVHSYKINYSNNNLEIFVSYYASTKLNIFDQNIITNNQYKEKHFSYKLSNYLTELKAEQLNFFSKKIKKNYLNNFENNNKIVITKNFINQFCQSISIFLNNKTNIIVTFQQLNKNFKKKIDKKEMQTLKKTFSKFYRYKNDKFYKNGLNIMYNSSLKSNSAFLLSEFIANNLSKLKRHNYFLRFIIQGLQVFKNNTYSKLKGVKIKITGRINTRPRAKHRFIKIGKEIPLLSIKSKIDYAEKTAFTSNGTLGVKVWTLH